MLLTTRPTDRYADELEAFGQLAGVWRTEITGFAPDGSPDRNAVGDWEFGYALDGRAVVDVWRVPTRSEPVDEASREVGLCVRIWDPLLQLWRFTFHSTVAGTVVHMYGRRSGDEIVLERAAGDAIERWAFSAIEADRFTWRSEVSTHGGPWRRLQDVEARRVPTSGAALTEALIATGPHPSIAEPARVFDRFAGAWDCAFTHFDRAGAVVEEYAGEVVFGWVLDGRAVQDAWIGYPTEPDGEPSVGTTVRFYDPTAGQWTVVWIAPQDGVVRTLTGGPTDDGRIVLHGRRDDGSTHQWSFEDIEPDSFTWRSERQEPSGESWTTGRYRMTRRRGAR